MQEKWEQKVREAFDKIKQHSKPYNTDINGVNIAIFPNVFSPVYFTDSKWFAEQIPKIVGNKKLLEIGTGTGIVGLFAAMNGAKVTVTDINPVAVENAIFNFKKHNLSVTALVGDLYGPLPKDEKFDFIFWNHPFNYGENPNEEILLKSGFDFKYKSLEKYIKNGNLYLNNDGHLLLGTSNFADINKIQKIAEKYNYKLKKLSAVKIPIAASKDFDNEYLILEFLNRI